MRRLAAGAVLLALAACDRPAATPAAKPAEAAKPAFPAIEASEWAVGMGRNSVELAHFVGGDQAHPDLRLVCAEGDGFLAVLPNFTPVASEERLNIGSGGQVQTLVATKARAGAGVQATGPIADDLLAVFDGGGPISINHGYQNAGPFPAPPEAARRIFTDTCRKLRSQGSV